MKLSGPQFVAALLHISYKTKNGMETDVAPFLLMLSVQKLVEERLNGIWTAKVINHLGDIVVLAEFGVSPSRYKSSEMEA